MTRNATVWREEEKATVVIYAAYSTSFSGASISIFKLVFKLKFNSPVICLGRTLVCTKQWLFFFLSEPIRFRDNVTVQTAGEYENLIVPCEVEGDPAPTVTWTFNGKMAEGRLSVSFNSLQKLI